MKKLILSITMLAFSGMLLFAQLPEAIKISPLSSNGKTQITITFDPSKACENGAKSLVGETKIQMHSAAFVKKEITDGWGDYGIDYNATPKDGKHATTDLTANGDGTFSISFVPYDYYGVGGDSVVTGLSIVFNNGSWDKEGKDKGTSATDCIDFKVPLENKTSSVKQATTRFSAYPNPVVNELQITNSLNVTSVVITDLLGKEVLKLTSINNKDLTVATTNLKSGLYILSVYDVNGFSGSSKLIKK